MSGDQAKPPTKEVMIAALKAESDKVSFRLKDLHQEMMRLPIAERRKRWEEYYRRLGWLMQRQQEIAEATATVSSNHPDHPDGSGQRIAQSASDPAAPGEVLPPSLMPRWV